MDNNFAFVHALFHVVLFILIHGHRVQRRQPRRIPPAKAGIEAVTQLLNRKEIP